MCSFVLKALFLFTLLISLSLPGSVFADTIFVSPLTGTYAVGQTFSVRIMVSSPRQSINAISGVLSYPTSKLQVTSVSKIGSVLSLWVQEPTFSNSQGRVTFEGVVPNPGFAESNGRVLGVNFKVVGTGPADIRLTSGSLLANDGYGTNVLKTLGNASFILEQRQAELPVTPPAISESADEEATEPIFAPVPVEDERPSVSLNFGIPSLSTFMGWLMKFFSIVIPLVAIIFFLIHTTKKGVSNMRAVRKDLHGIDRLVGKSFDLIKEDISESIHILERARMKRRLTAEEDAIIHSLRQNLLDAEKAIHQEVMEAERDLGN